MRIRNDDNQEGDELGMKYVVGFIVGVAVGILISELMFAVKNN